MFAQRERACPPFDGSSRNGPGAVFVKSKSVLTLMENAQ